jgi:hypothetical protein
MKKKTRATILVPCALLLVEALAFIMPFSASAAFPHQSTTNPSVTEVSSKSTLVEGKQKPAKATVKQPKVKKPRIKKPKVKSGVKPNKAVNPLVKKPAKASVQNLF